MSDPDPAGFVERFTRVWKAPEPDAFADLWADGGRLLHPTMASSIPKDEIPDYVRRLKALAPDIHLEPRRWAAAGADVLIEWTISLTRDGEAVTWDGVDRFTLDGDRAVEGVAYFDTSPIWARLQGHEPPGDLLDAAQGDREAATA